VTPSSNAYGYRFAENCQPFITIPPLEPCSVVNQ
jgi:hypothetical protein